MGAGFPGQVIKISERGKRARSGRALGDGWLDGRNYFWHLPRGGGGCGNDAAATVGGNQKNVGSSMANGTKTTMENLMSEYTS